MSRKKKLGVVAAIIIICASLLLCVAVHGRMGKTSSIHDIMDKIDIALDGYTKLSATELVATLQYGDDEGNTINYHILKTTYYESAPSEVIGLNTDAIQLIIDPELADSCRELKIQDWDAALYEKGELSYLCWTYSPEVSYVLEYNPNVVSDEEIIKMAESAKIMRKK